MMEMNNCRKTFPNHYIRLMAFESTRGVESIAMSFIVNRPRFEPGSGLVRQEVDDRRIRYTVHSYATDKPEGERYGS
jgi:ribulose-bisphosphate carboxylase small chain